MSGKTKLVIAVVAFVFIVSSAAYAFVLNTAVPSGSSVALADTGNAVTETDSARESLNEAIIFYIGSPKAIVGGIEKMIDETDPEVTPVITDDVRLVPLRFIAESLGAEVEWDQDSLTAKVTLGGVVYEFTHGKSVIRAGKLEYDMGYQVTPIKGRTFIPLGKFVEALGMSVFYDRGLIVIGRGGKSLDASGDEPLISGLISRLSFLPTVGTYDKLKQLLEEARKSRTAICGGLTIDSFDSAAATAQKSMVSEEAESSAVPADYSETNVQVQGVDEADIVKTDGEYIYRASGKNVAVIKAFPPENMEVLSVTATGGADFIPLGLYLHDQKLIVIGSSYGNIPVRRDTSEALPKIHPPYQYVHNTTKVVIYDISDKRSIKPVREVEIEGEYVSSRKIGSSLYLIANRHINYYHIEKIDENLTPSYRDTLAGDDFVSIGYDSIYYFPGTLKCNYMIVAGIDIEGTKKADVSTYLGAGQNIYASAENLYVAVTAYKTGDIRPLDGLSEGREAKLKVGRMEEESTIIYKFGLGSAKVTYLCKGEVPGKILNQFSMDEYKGHFRIATTKGDIWRTDEHISKNNLYIMDDVLSITGKVEGIAPGEKIYSVRFMGDRAYMVTFKKVDPLFVIDLKNPANPSVLGALKIPGYSDYLHPYDENHIIGFGKDTVEIKGQAYYTGMKIALFDVTDVTNPVQKFSEIIGDRGTDSELLQDHKALLFSREKNIMAFPVTVMEAEGDSANEKGEPLLKYGKFTFQGAYIYNIDLSEGFKLKGKITHLSEEDYLKAGSGWYESEKNIRRILYINDTLYTVSDRMLKANTIGDLSCKASVEIP